MTETIKILAFAGSLRRGSYNRALVAASAARAPHGVTVEPFDLIDLPLYNEDVERLGLPDAVTAFHHAIRAADAVLVVTPEYNHGLPGVTKNAIDWGSRPPGSAPLDGKPVGVIGASSGPVGTARCQVQMRQVFVGTNSYCMPKPEILVAKAQEKFDGEGRLTDETTAKFLTGYLEALAAWARRFKA